VKTAELHYVILKEDETGNKELHGMIVTRPKNKISTICLITVCCCQLIELHNVLH
jgi:hypothetical protein